MKHTEYIVPIGEEATDYDEMFIGVIRRQPELVRCKDCQYYVDECCERYADETLGYVHSTQPDYFCAVAARKEEYDCNDCYYSMQNCKDKAICCEDETALCGNFEPVVEKE